MSIAKTMWSFCIMPLALSLGILCLWSPAAQAEGSFGFFGGINLAKMTGDMDEISNDMDEFMADALGGTWSSENTTKPGLGFGTYYYLKFSPTFGLQFEGQYIERGGRLDITASNIAGYPATVEAEINFQLSYLEVPVLARLTASPESSFHPILLGGPALSIETSSEVEVVVEGANASMGSSSITKSTSFGFILGAGFAMDLGTSTSLVMQGRYYLGITDALEDMTYKAKNGGVGFFAGLEFPIGN